MSSTTKILIAYDGSDCAEAALDDLRRAGLPPRGVEALALAVADVIMLPPPSPSSSESIGAGAEAGAPGRDQRYAKNVRAVEEARGLARRAGEQLRQNFPEWEVRAEAAAGSPAWEIVARADGWKPDLVVVGSHGRSAVGRFVLGSVSQRVLTEARCSVRVARGRVKTEDLAVRVVVGADGSRASEAAVRAVAARHWPQGSEARVIVALAGVSPGEEAGEAARGWADAAADAAVETLRRAGLPAAHAVRAGDPKRVLVGEAEAWGADSIFVGSTGTSSRFERFLLGSVSATVAARAHCSVEVVREAGRGER